MSPLLHGYLQLRQDERLPQMSLVLLLRMYNFMQVDAADNIDLMTIVQEFVDYYHSKFGRYPKLIRRNYAPPVAFQVCVSA